MSFETARAGKIYLQAQPIVDAAALVPSDHLWEYHLRGNFTSQDTAYVSFLSNPIEQNMGRLVSDRRLDLTADSIHLYSKSIAHRIVRAKLASLRMFSDRGIIQPNSISLIDERREFDVAPLTEASLDMILEYRNAQMVFPHQMLMIRRFLPVSYLNWMRGKYDVSDAFLYAKIQTVPFAHIGVEQTIEKATALSEKRGISFKSAMNLVISKPTETSAILSGSAKPPEASEETEMKSADGAQDNAACRRAYEEARDSKAYLQVQPILEAGMRAETARENTGLYGRKIGIIDSEYKQQLIGAVQKAVLELANEKGFNIPETVLLQGAQRAALSLLTMPPSLASDIVSRGMISPENDRALTKRELFDVHPFAEAILDIINEYQGEGLSPMYQLFMMKRFFPVSYLKWIKARTFRNQTEIDYYIQNAAFPHVKLGISLDAGAMVDVINGNIVLRETGAAHFNGSAGPEQEEHPTEISINSEAFKKAREEKAYLRAQPILDEASRPGFLADHYRRGGNHRNTEYISKITQSIAENLGKKLKRSSSSLAQQHALIYAAALTKGILYQRPRMLELFAKRGILSPEDIVAIINKKEFDVSGVSEVALEMISEYDNAGIPLREQIPLIQNCFPLEYLDLLRQSGCYGSIIGKYLRLSKFPHIAIEHMTALAKALVDKYDVPITGARYMAFLHPSDAKRAMESSRDQARQIFKGCGAAFEEKDAKPQENGIRIEINVSIETFEAARREKAYLMAQPIIDTTSRPGFDIKEYSSGVRRGCYLKYDPQMIKTLSVRMSDILANSTIPSVQRNAAALSETIIDGMLRKSSKMLGSLAERGILSPEDIRAMSEGREFDVQGIATVADEMMSEYEKAGLSPDRQMILIRDFLPVEYLNRVLESAGYEHLIFYYIRSSNVFPHLAFDRMSRIASELIDKWQVPAKGARKMAFLYPESAQKALQGTEEDARAIFKNCRAAFEEKGAAVKEPEPQFEVTVSAEEYESAKRDRTYLQAEPIIDASANKDAFEYGKYGFMRKRNGDGHEHRMFEYFRDELSRLARERGGIVRASEISRYAYAIAGSLSRMTGASLLKLSERGIIEPGSVPLILEHKEFNMAPVAEAAFDMIAEYHSAGMKPAYQEILLKRFFPLSYLNIMRGLGCTDGQTMMIAEKSNFPHVQIERQAALARSLVEKWNCPLSGAQNLAFHSPASAMKALETNDVDRARRIFMQNAAVFDIPIEVKTDPAVSEEAYAKARSERAYLAAQPIIDAAAKRDPSLSIAYGYIKRINGYEYENNVSVAIKNELTSLAQRRGVDMPLLVLSRYGNLFAQSLLKMSEASLWHLAERGILPPQSVLSIRERTMFDMAPVAEAMLEMLTEYEASGVALADQMIMLKRFFPLSYLEKMRGRGLTDSMVLRIADVHAFPHEEAERQIALADSIVDKFGVPQSSARNLVNMYPGLAKGALEWTVDRARRIFKQKRIAFEGDAGTLFQTPDIPMQVSPEKYQEARNAKAYLLAEQIVTEARIASEHPWDYGFKSRLNYAASEYLKQLEVAFKQAYAERASQSGITLSPDDLAKYSSSVAENLSRLKSKSLWQLSARGIVPPDSIALALRLKPFDIGPVADATWQMITEYQEQDISPELRSLLFSKLLPVSYLRLMRYQGFSDSIIYRIASITWYPHLKLGKAQNTANVLVAKFGVPVKSAVRIASERPKAAERALSATREEARRIFARYRAAFIKMDAHEKPVNLIRINLGRVLIEEAERAKIERKKAFTPPVSMPVWVTAQDAEFIKARQEKLYLKAELIIDDGSSDGTVYSTVAMPYPASRRDRQAQMIERALHFLAASRHGMINNYLIREYANEIAISLCRMPLASIHQLTRRGILSPEDAFRLNNRELFDPKVLAEALFDMIAEYSNAGLSYSEQKLMLRGFLPISYFNWIKSNTTATIYQILEALKRSDRPHLKLVETEAIAVSLVKKWQVNINDAFNLALKSPDKAKTALETDEPGTAAKIFEYFGHEFPIKHFVAQASTVPETIEKTTVFAPAKRRKLYLTAEPIIKAGSELLENELANYDRKKDIDERYALRLTGLIEKNLAVIVAKSKMALGAALLHEHANSIARGLLSQRTVSLLLLSDRGIITRSSILAMSRNEDFDTIPIAEAALDLIEEYKKAGLADTFQGLMLGGMFPVAYLNWMMRTYNVPEDALKQFISKEVFPHRAYDRAGAMATALVAKHGVNFKDAMHVAAESYEDAKRAYNGALSDAAKVFTKYGVPFEEKKPEIGIRVIPMRPSLSIKPGDLYFGDRMFFDRYMVMQLSGKQGVSPNMVKRAQQMLALFENDVNIYDVLFVLLRYPNNTQGIMAVIYSEAQQLAIKHGISIREAMFYAKCHPFAAEKEYAKLLERFIEIKKKYTVDDYTMVNRNTIMFFLKKYGEDAEYQLEQALAKAGELSRRTGIDPSDVMSHVMAYGDDAKKHLKGTVAAAERLAKEYALSMDDAMFCVQVYPGDPAFAAVEICGAVRIKDLKVSR